MKKLLILISFFVCYASSFGQPKIIRSTGSNTVFDTRLGALSNLIIPIYNDTTEANVSLAIGIDSTAATIFTRDVMSTWIRVCCPKRWVQIAKTEASQFNAIAGSNISLTGTYPNITFNAGTTGLTTVPSGSASTIFLATVASDAGSNPVFLFNSSITIATRPLLYLQNNGSNVFSIAASGQITNGFLGGSGTKLIQTTNTGSTSASAIDPATVVITSVLADSIDNRITGAVRHVGTDSVFVTTYNGSQTFAFLTSAIGAGITSLNGETGATQTFAVGTAGTDFAVSSASNIHTFNLPDASATARGVINTTNQTIAGNKTLTGDIVASGNLSSNVSFTNSNFMFTGGVGSGTTTASQFLVEGAAGTNFRTLFYGSVATVNVVNQNYSGIIVNGGLMTEGASGNIALASSATFIPLTVNAGTSTMSNAFTVYISGAPTATVSDQTGALWVASGNVRLGKAGTASGTMSFEGSTSGKIIIQPLAAAGTYTLTLPPDDGTSGQAIITDGNGVLTFATVAGLGTVTSVEAGLGMNFPDITTTGDVILDTAYAMTKGTAQVVAGFKNFTGTAQILRAGIGTTVSSSTALTVAGTGYTNGVVLITGSVTGQVGTDHYASLFASTIVEAASGNHSILAGVGVGTVIITSGSATATNVTNLYVASDPTATVSGITASAIFAGRVAQLGSTSGYIRLNAPAVSGTTDLTWPAVTGTIVAYSEASITSSATPSPTGNARENNLYITALATNATFAAPSGPATNGNSLLITITCAGTGRTLAWNGIYNDGTDIALPTSILANETIIIKVLYSASRTVWDLAALTRGL